MSRREQDKSPAWAADRETLAEVVLDSASEGIVVADEDGRFLVWNRAATELVGIGAADVPPERWSEYYHICWPDSDEPVPADQLPLVRAIRGEVVDDFDLTVRHAKTGRRVLLNCYARPMLGDRGEIRGGVVVFRDVTERRRAERELESFARTVSHDLKAPLTGITGFAQALREEFAAPLGAEGLEYVQQIEAAAGRMRDLIDALLLHARVGHDWQRRAPVDLAVVVQRAIENLAVQIDSSGADITVQKGLPVVSGYAAGLEQAFQNLIGNALKFVAPGQRPLVEVGCVDEGNSCKVFVRDRGVGIDPKYRRSVFEVFRRLHGQDEFAGTGIGLAIVQKVADLHCGDVWVESSPGRGSTFWLRLPKKAPDGVEKAGPGPTAG